MLENFIMEKYIYDEKNELWYELHVDYYIPCLELPTEKNSLSAFGGSGTRHISKKHRKFLHTNLLTSGKLNSYLADINEQAQEMYLRLIDEMADRQGVTEQLKAEKPMEWVGRMGNIQSCVREIVISELIYA